MPFRVEESRGRTATMPAALWQFRIIAGISKSTADYYGGFAVAKNLILNQISTVNHRFNNPHVFNGTMEFTVDSIYEFTGNPLNELFVPHPRFDYRVTYDGFPTQGGGWYGPPWNSIHHSWPVTSFGGPFAAYATDGIVHEFGHSRGAIDLYAIQVSGAKNTISHQPYSAEMSIMNCPYGVTVWDQHSINLINRNGTTVFSSLDYIDGAFPADIRVSVRDSTGDSPLQGSVVKLYPVIWYRDSLRETLMSSWVADQKGEAIQSANPFMPFTPGPPWNISYPNFLVSSEFATVTNYVWFPMTAVQSAYFMNPDTTFRLIVKMPLSCCNGSTEDIDCDPANGTDISDLSALIDNLYISFTPLCCKQAANVDGSLDGNVDISDLSALIDFLYISFTPPAACR